VIPSKPRTAAGGILRSCLTLRRPSDVKRREPAPSSNPIQEALDRYEFAELELARIQQENSDLFDRVDTLKAIQTECLATAKRLVYSDSGPPAGVSGRVHRPAAGKVVGMKVTYKKHADYYDPSRLPKDILAREGIVKEVDREAVAGLKDPRCEAALVTGKWMTPSLEIERLKKNEEPESE
jgi:hypothetical protein